MSKYYRSIFISDLHLGSRGSRADDVLKFLNATECEHLYLVGDIIDGWALRRHLYFPEAHRAVVRCIMAKAANGTNVYWTPGNHDEFARAFVPFHLGTVTVDNELIHQAADGRRYLVVHGDCYDQVVNSARWLALLGDIGYSFLLRCNGWINTVRHRYDYDHWSLSAYLKRRIKTAVKFIGEYEHTVATSIKERGLDGVICGHIHCAEKRQMEGIQYLNCGDWVESCTALVEHPSGSIDLLYLAPNKKTDT